jgi:dTDP-4-amino-4,6-dideoxygalactose transaminase
MMETSMDLANVTRTGSVVTTGGAGTGGSGESDERGTLLEPSTAVLPVPIVRPWFDEQEAEAAAEVVRSRWIAQGQRVVEFESAFAERVGADHAIAVTNCTAGLHLALVVLGVGHGDEVIVPSLSFIATANAVRYVGATPVFVDVDPRTHNVTPEGVSSAFTEKTKAVIAVHQSGVPADVDALRSVCEPRGVAIIEDAACAIGSTYYGRPVGQGAELAAFSFHPRKVLVTGEGGMVTTTNPEWATRLRRLRDHGMSVSQFERHNADKPIIEQYLETGFNYRMTDLQAAIGCVQLGKLEVMLERRRACAARYADGLGDIPGIELVSDPEHGTTNFQSYWVVLPDDFPMHRNELLATLLGAGVSARRGIMASHLEPAFSNVSSPPLPVTERVTHQSLLLPLFHEITDAQQDHIVDVIRRAGR